MRKVILASIAASVLLYCGVAYQKVIPDASAQDSGTGDASVCVQCECECPPPPPTCSTCPVRYVLEGAISGSGSIYVGDIPNFDQSNFPSITMVTKTQDGMWEVSNQVLISITSNGAVMLSTQLVEMHGREFKIILQWTAPNE